MALNVTLAASQAFDQTEYYYSEYYYCFYYKETV